MHHRRQCVVAGFVALALGVFLLLVPVSSDIEVKWQTASEVNTAGFDVYRSENGSEPVRVNRQLIPARGSPLTGAEYTFVDRTARPFHRYEYVLEEVERDGKKNRYPQKVLATAGPPALPFRMAGGALVLLSAVLVTIPGCRLKN